MYCDRSQELYVKVVESMRKEYFPVTEQRPVVISEGISNPGTEMRPEDPIAKAKKRVVETIDWNFKRKRMGYEELPAYEVYVVMFAYILGGWKAIVSTDMPDGKYYEVTYNSVKKETYIDMYVKQLNVCIPDLSEME